MKLNTSKCFALNVTFSRNPQPHPILTIDDTLLPNVHSTKILGVIVQSNLKWDGHIAEIIKKCNRKLYMFRTIRKYGLPLDDLKTVYTGYIRPVLEYCAPVFNGGLTKGHVKSLEQIQKRVFKIMLGPNYVSYQHACRMLDLPTLESRRHKLQATRPG